MLALISIILHIFLSVTLHLNTSARACPATPRVHFIPLCALMLQCQWVNLRVFFQFLWPLLGKVEFLQSSFYIYFLSQHVSTTGVLYTWWFFKRVNVCSTQHYQPQKRLWKLNIGRLTVASLSNQNIKKGDWRSLSVCHNFFAESAF